MEADCGRATGTAVSLMVGSVHAVQLGRDDHNRTRRKMFEFAFAREGTHFKIVEKATILK